MLVEVDQRALWLLLGWGWRHATGSGDGLGVEDGLAGVDVGGVSCICIVVVVGLPAARHGCCKERICDKVFSTRPAEQKVRRVFRLWMDREMQLPADEFRGARARIWGDMYVGKYGVAMTTINTRPMQIPYSHDVRLPGWDGPMQ